jgi:acetylornithine deacetylase/succinyl-diaminopimelate desuccinylase-like protein
MSDAVSPVVALLGQLIRIPSPNPPGDCAAIAAFCEDFLGRAGFETRTLAPDEQAWSVVAWAGPADGPSILYHAHIDTVPLGQNARWSYDPFAGTIADGRIYGLGSIDDKAPLAAMLQVAADIAPNIARLRGRLVIVCAADEETGGRRGTQWLAENGHLPVCDFVVVGEQTHNRVALANKGVVRAAFHTAGRTAHATEPTRGANAINGMARLIADLERYQAGVLDRRAHPLLGRPSINVGVIAGGVSANVVADACTIRVDRRTVPGEDPQAVIAELRSLAAERQALDPELTFTVDSFQISNWFQADADNPFTQRLLAISGAETGTPPEPIGYLPGSDAKHLVTVARQGMVVLGPGTYEVAHSTDEHTVIEELEATYRILGRFAAEVLLAADVERVVAAPEEG